MKNHKIFQRNEKFTLIEQITETCTTNYQTVMASSKETGQPFDSKTENTLPRWFELRT